MEFLLEVRYFGTTFLTAAEKTKQSLPKFRTTIKEKLLSMANKINYF